MGPNISNNRPNTKKLITMKLIIAYWSDKEYLFSNLLWWPSSSRYAHINKLKLKIRLCKEKIQIKLFLFVLG